jgi:branched-chain amino acid transport system ATP-binding protein
MQLLRDLGDRVFVMHYGSELACGAPAEVLADPNVIQAYIGRR